MRDTGDDDIERDKRIAALEDGLRAGEVLARCEHASGCGAQCRCGAWGERNVARAELYRHYRALLASPEGKG